MQPDEYRKWNDIFLAKAAELYPPTDPSHDILHIRRVVAMAMKIAEEEGADINVILPAAYFHDFVNVPKNDPRRKKASALSAEAAVAYLKTIGYPERYLAAIAHAIAAHSFSAGIPPETPEARIVQDADRLDALGAIGVARCFSTNAFMGTQYYHETDALAESRDPDDRFYAVDHFFVKLFKLPAMLNTAAAKAEAEKRVAFMRDYLQQMQKEVPQDYGMHANKKSAQGS